MTPSENEQLQAEIVLLIPALRAFAKRFYRSQTNAEDLVQDTLVRALGNVDKFQPHSALASGLKSWMFTIMRNTFCTRVRREKRETPSPTECVSSTRAMEPSQEWSLAVSEFETAFQHISPHQRDVILRVVLDGETYEDAAVRCGCAVGTIKSRVNRARQQLAEEIGWSDHADQ